MDRGASSDRHRLKWADVRTMINIMNDNNNIRTTAVIDRSAMKS